MAKTGTQLAPSRMGGLSSDPFRELFELQRGIHQLFDEGYGSQREDVALKAWAPPVDIYEDENSFLIKVELPEINREDVKVSLNENVLSITVERSYGQFHRSFTLPQNVAVDTINAQFKDGVLRLTLPKKEEAKPKQIEVKVQ